MPLYMPPSKIIFQIRAYQLAVPITSRERLKARRNEQQSGVATQFFQPVPVLQNAPRQPELLPSLDLMGSDVVDLDFDGKVGPAITNQEIHASAVLLSWIRLKGLRSWAMPIQAATKLDREPILPACPPTGLPV
jgi:hypothetical protein